jgi:UPF0755 protein
MTDYGRGHGSEPWHPEDPLFGNQWSGPQQQSQYQQSGYDHPGYQQSGYEQSAYEQSGYDQNGNWDPYATGQQPQYPYNGNAQQYHPQQQAPQRNQNPQQYDAWGNPVTQAGTYGVPADPQSADPYGARDPRGGPPSYEQPEERQPTGQRTDWDPDPEAPAADDHPFFSNDTDEDVGRFGRRRAETGVTRSGSNATGGKKRRSGCACLAVALALGGAVGGAAWFGYTFYQERFGPPPDYSGQGSGEVQIEIPDGATLTDMGNILEKSGVVKSVGAFNGAAQQNAKSIKIQSGVYVLRKHMSAASAITMMLDPKAQSVLIIAEGMRDTQVYQAIDAKLNLAKGTTQKVARSQVKNLGLPSWAGGSSESKDPLEGFLFPSRYSVGDKTEPLGLLRRMVSQSNKEFAAYNLNGDAKQLGLKSPLQILTVASLVQAEAQQSDEFGMVSRVIYNRLDYTRLDGGMALGFDSTINYALGRSTLDTSKADTSIRSPYNTYLNKGLPPGPIGNPGHQALLAAINPTPGKWLYFVTVKPGDTRFTDNYAVHQKNVQDFNTYKREHGG